MAIDLTKYEWLLEKEAAEYCRCSLWAFRKMSIPANNSGGRKVYRRTALDAALNERPWTRGQTSSKVDLTQVHYGRTLADRLKGERIRPFVPRKKV